MKIRKKFFISISLLIIILFFIFIGINSFFLEKYYLYTKKQELNRVKIEYLEGISKEKIEQLYGVVVIESKLEKNLNNFNESLRLELERKKVKLNKLWFTKEDLKKLEKNKDINKLYNQGLIKASFLTTVFIKEGKVILIGNAVPHLEESIVIMNRFIVIIMIIGMGLLLLVLWILIKNILYPLEKLNVATENISHLKFSPIEIKTGDEIENLSLSINTMSNKLKDAYEELNSKNRNLKIFMSDITHELKTPLSLIKAYSIGMKDGLDDGTFLDEILKQNINMENLLDELLEFTKIQREDIDRKKFSLNELIDETLKEFSLELKKMNFYVNLDEKISIFADREKIKRVIKNLISNGIKYSSDNNLEINLQKGVLSFKNGIKKPYEDVENLWEPFFVGEKSRDKKSSGTGLGLSIVKEIIKTHGYFCKIEQNEKTIEFIIDFRIK